MQNGVLDAADVLIHRQPLLRCTRLDQAAGALRAGIAGVVPGRFHKSVHGVGFSPRRAAALGAGAFIKFWHLGQRRARAVRHHVFRQHHRQLFVRHWHVAAAWAVDDGNRAAPVALAGNAPIAQAELHFFLAQAPHDQIGGHGLHGGLIAQAIVFAGIHAHALFLVAIPFLPGIGGKARTRHLYGLRDGQIVFFGKAKIAFVMRRHGHHRAVAVAHQHIVTDPHRHFCASQWVDDLQPGVHALLFHGSEIGLGHATLFAFLDKRCQRRIIGGGLQGQRMLGGHRHEGDAHDGVGAGRVHPQFFVVAIGEGKAHAGAFANPVALHGFDLLRPAGQAIQIGQQLFGVIGDAEEIHGDFALFHQRAGAPAAPVNHLLIGQHGLIYRIPVHSR